MADIDISKKPVATNESGALAKLWRLVLVENNLVPQLTYLINKYVSKTKYLETNGLKAQKLKTKSTITADVTSRTMTMKTFLYLLFNFLNAKEVEISVKVTFPSGVTSTHRLPIKSNQAEDIDLEEVTESGGNDGGNKTENA